MTDGARPRIAVFDLGGVLIEWNPRHLYRKLIPDAAVRERFLAEVCSPVWNAEQDRGRPIRDAVAERVARFPEHAPLIAAYYERFDEMIPGAIEPMVELLARLDEAGVPLYALTNWSAETFAVAERRFGFLSRFREIVVSGRIRLIKPDPRIFRHLSRVCGAAPGDTLFIDDNRPNIDTAATLGFHVVHHVDADETAAAVRRFGLLA